VEINDEPAPDGTLVEARGEGVQTPVQGNPIEVTEPGKYGGPGGLDPKLVVKGDIEEGTTLTFYVDGVAAETAEWHSGEVTELPLSVTITIPRRPGPGVGPARDTTPPRISNVLLCFEGVTETTADICWVTNEKSTSQVEYWTSPSMLSPLDETLVTEHHVELTGLTPGTTYHYKTMSIDRAGNEAVSDEYSFTTLGKPPEKPAAAFTSKDLSIYPSEVNMGETVTISLTVTNTGTAAGSYKVTLMIDGAVEATEEVTLEAGVSKEVTFTTSKDKAATYSVAVNGLSDSFIVKEKPAPPPPPPPAPPPPEAPPVEVINWPVVGGIIAGVVVVGLLIFFLVRRRAA